MRINFPVRRLAPAGDNHCGARGRTIGTRWHRGGEMHQRSDTAENPLRVIDQSHQLAQVRPATEIEHILERWMIVTDLSNLDEEDPAAKMIDDSLVSPPVPPFDGEVEFAARIDDPERQVAAGQFVHS